jgi:hypothetical protein
MNKESRHDEIIPSARQTKEESPMSRKKCLTFLASALTIAATVLSLSGAARAITYKVIHQFQLPRAPEGNLTIDAARNLYGTSYDGGEDSAACVDLGCGTVWKLAPNANGTWGALTVLHKFTGADGGNPAAGLVFDAVGNLYGTTYFGGPNQCNAGGPDTCGVVFKLAPNPDGNWTETVLHSFTGGADGALPSAGLIFDAAGNLYGTAQIGGTPGCGGLGCGVVFKLTPNPDGTWTESVLYSFKGVPDGSSPFGRLIFDSHGNLYGTTSVGGDAGQDRGTAFKLVPNPDGTWTESVLHSFTGGADGGSPYAGVTLDADGNPYGTTYYGGDEATPGNGVVWKLAPNPDGTWTETVLHSFTGGPDGGYPRADLIFDAAGSLNGTTAAGGDLNACGGGCGVVFKLTPTNGSWSEVVLHAFLGYGKLPESPVFLDPQGNLYGTTSEGSNNFGLIFEITP